jgi:hypothetical protein
MSCLGPFRPSFDFEADFISLIEGFETAALDTFEVNEHILPAFGLDEAITLLVIKPFYSTFRHI